MCGDVAGRSQCSERKRSGAEVTGQQFLREAKARRGKSMKTCTRRGRLRSTISAGGKQTERINSRNKRRALVTIHQKTT